MQIIENIQKELISTLLSNKKICALIGIPSADAFLSSNPPTPKQLKDKFVFDYKFIPTKQEDKAIYLTCDYIVEAEVSNIRVTTAIYIFVHQDLVRLIDGRNRIFALSTEITNTLKQTVQKGTLPGIGRWTYGGLSGTNLSSSHPGVCLIYEAVDTWIGGENNGNTNPTSTP